MSNPVFTKKQVLDVCKTIVPIYKFDPFLVFAICLKESEKTDDGEFRPDVARLEQNYYRKYTVGLNLSTTGEVLLSASYGVSQIMGLSLYEAAYFDWYFNQLPEGMQKLFFNPVSQYAIPSALDAYSTNLNWQIEWTCKWLDRKHRLAGGDIFKMLSFWNGDKTGGYANSVLDIYKKVLSEVPTF